MSFDLFLNPNVISTYIDEKFIEWVKTKNDPELWHYTAIDISAYSDDPSNFLSWVIEQENVDQATAFFLFIHKGGIEYLQGEANFHQLMSDQRVIDLLEKIIARSETIGFKRNSMGVYEAGGYREAQKKCIQLNDANELSRTLPTNLFFTEYGEEPNLEFKIMFMGEREVMLDPKYYPDFPVEGNYFITDKSNLN